MTKKVSYFIETPDLDIITGYPCFNYIENLDPVWATSLPSVTYEIRPNRIDTHIYTICICLLHLSISHDYYKSQKAGLPLINLAQKEA